MGAENLMRVLVIWIIEKKIALHCRIAIWNCNLAAPAVRIRGYDTVLPVIAFPYFVSSRRCFRYININSDE